LTTHRFTVNVPNPTAQRSVANLSLKTAKRRELNGLALDLPRRSLNILRAAIALDPCDCGKDKRMTVKLRPYSSLDIHVEIETASAQGAAGIVAVHLVDRRPDGRAGGVLLVASDPAIVDPAGQVVDVKNPCPVVLAGRLYPVDPEHDPSHKPAATIFPAGREFDLVVPVTNPTRIRLADVQVYLEHLGACDASFRPVLWNIGIMNPRDVFFATWRVTTARQNGKFQVSIVAVSRRTNPVRLTASIQVVDKADVANRFRK
jgi:hypothetical protein